MNEAVLILLLRMLAAVVLIALFATAIWFVIKDLRRSTQLLEQDEQSSASLQVVTTVPDAPPLETIFPLWPVTSIGRSAGNTIVLETTYTSGRHALITRRAGQWWLQDVGSSNGTLLNGVPLPDPSIISPGDVVGIGGVELKLLL